jgi:type I restriction enzyme S subunit
MTFSVRKVTLGDVCEIKQGRYLAPNQMEPVPTTECFVPVVGGNGVLGFTDQSTLSFPVPLVTCRGSKCGLMQWAEPPTWISNNAMAVYFKENQGDNFFLHQYLLHSSFDDVTTGSAQPQITVTNLSLKQILLPNLQTQTTISLIMKSLEEKISSNDALSKTLEEIAQTIFKSWFIDFDPVKAKMAGEKPAGMDAATAELFPDSMEESEMGLIPKGWRIGSLEEIVDLQGGYAFKSSSWTDCGVPVIKIGSVKPGYVDLTQVSYVDTSLAEGISDDYRIPAGSLVVGLTGYVGQVGLVRTHEPVPLVNQRVAKFKPRSGDWKIPFIYCFTRDPKFKVIVEELSTGTAQQNVSNSQILSIPLVIPNNEIQKSFEDSLTPLFNQIINLADENESLKSLRDALLPRLISGELQIPEEMLAS